MTQDRFDYMDEAYAATVASRAAQCMSHLSIPATPCNYAVWFHYVLGSSPGLRKTIDILLGNKRRFDTATNKELHRAFVDSRPAALPAGDAPQQLNGIIDRATAFLRAAIADNSTQIAALDGVAAQVAPNGDPRLIIQALVSELTKASRRATTLERNFTETAKQLETVQLSLAKAEMQSKTDALTGLANRRSFDDVLRSAMIHAMETAEPLCVLMIDIDHFKRFNDTHGHLVGDQVLRLVAKVLRDSLRDSDLAARYGGEELVAVLPGIDLTSCGEVAERVRRRISDAKLTKRTSGQEIGSVTVSIGVAQFRLGEAGDTLIERCDRGLYRAKNAGRNRVVTETEIEDTAAASPGPFDDDALRCAR